MVSTISTPTAAEKKLVTGFRTHAPPADGAMADYGMSPASAAAYELQRCLGLVLSSAASTSGPGAGAGAGGGVGGGDGAGAAGGVWAGAGGATAGPAECCDALLRILRNVLTKPGEPKYRCVCGGRGGGVRR